MSSAAAAGLDHGRSLSAKTSGSPMSSASVPSDPRSFVGSGDGLGRGYPGTTFDYHRCEAGRLNSDPHRSARRGGLHARELTNALNRRSGVRMSLIDRLRQKVLPEITLPGVGLWAERSSARW